MSLFQAHRLLTPTMSTFHHSDWWPFAVATMWLCAGSSTFPAPLPSTADRSMYRGWSMQWPVWHCRVRFGGVKPSGTITYSGSKVSAGVWV